MIESKSKSINETKNLRLILLSSSVFLFFCSCQSMHMLNPEKIYSSNINVINVTQ
jgi:hypothetical protein